MSAQKATDLDQLKLFAQRSKAAAEAAAKAAADGVTVPTKVSELTNDSGFQTADQVTAAVNTKLSSTYKAAGSVAFASLPTADEAHLGMVYNVTDAFTTTDAFVGGAGKNFPAGTNVVVVSDGDGFKYDTLAGFVDLTGYVAKEDGKVLSSNDFTDADKIKLDGMNFATNEEVNAVLDEVFGTAGA